MTMTRANFMQIGWKPKSQFKRLPVVALKKPQTKTAICIGLKLLQLSNL